MKRFLLILATITFTLFQVNAQIHQVPADHSTIQAAIDTASVGDTILVEEDTYYENINFKGRPITVASRFILDGDTSHISRTIIDGSQAPNPDTSSTVLMISGEDTTSVLAGFTITGGGGTVMTEYTELYGGGIAVYGSGGMIIHNIIESNHVQKTLDYSGTKGGGIGGSVHDSHTLIVRDNIIRNNQLTGETTFGAGICVLGGKILIEHNTINDNTINGTGWNNGGGIAWEVTGMPGAIKEACIRNNIISGNKCPATEGEGNGGGIFCDSYGRSGTLHIYNNLIFDNYAGEIGGGIWSADCNSLIMNNTILNNTAGVKWNSIVLFWSERSVLFNNIIRTNAQNSHENIGFVSQPPGIPHAYMYDNLLEEMPGQNEYITFSGNTYLEPVFEEGSYSPAPESPAVGRGADSVEADGVWYYAPGMDLSGNMRPNGIDPYVDIGAIESGFARGSLSNANLFDIILEDYELDPPIDNETLKYVMGVLEGTQVTDLMAVPEDGLATVEIDHATNIESDDAADRTTTIIVNSPDSSTQKIYEVEFKIVSTDASLSELSVSLGTLEPEFSSIRTSYKVELPAGTTETPTVSYETTNEYASVEVSDAADVTSSEKADRTSTIKVISESGTRQRTYRIEFYLEPEVGMDERTNAGGVKIYPNPIHFTATIELYEPSKVQRIELVNILGETVRIIIPPYGRSITFYRQGLPPGLYFLNVHSDISLIEKLIIE